MPLFRLALALSAFAAAAALPAADGPPPPPAGWTDVSVLANGIRIHYWRTGGDKPPMVMAHGSSDNGLCWTALALELQDRYDLILYDARGHGFSDPGGPEDASDVQADDLAGLIRALDLDKPIVMGHSMGASAAAWFAAKYPDIPGAVVLEDPGLLPRNRSGGGSVEERRAQILERNNESYYALVASCLENNPAWGVEECRIWAPSKQQHHPNTAYRRIGDRPPMAELLAKITAPTLILKADASPAVREQNQEVANRLRRGTLVHIDGAGHNVRRERKQALMHALNEFLAKL